MVLSEIESLKQRYFHEKRKNQRLRKAQQSTADASGRRSSQSRKSSHTKSPPTSSEKVGSSLEIPSPKSNEMLSPPGLSSSEEEDDNMRSRKCKGSAKRAYNLSHV